MTSIKQLHVSAPGKVIICGEHAVVYGKKALSCSINLRTHIKAKKLEQHSNTFKVTFNDMQKVVEISEENFMQIKNKFTEIESNKDSDIVLAKLLEQESDYLRNSIEYLIIILDKLQWDDLCDFDIQVSSELPIAAGLGSSASFSSCLALVFLILGKLIPTYKSKELNEDQRKLINEYAFNIEKLFHGKPSGIDNTIVTYGKYVLFQNGKIVEKFNSSLNLDVLIINSKIPKKTREQVDKVRLLNTSYKQLTDEIFNSIDILVDEFKVSLRESDLKKINELININQGLLYSINISNYHLNLIVNLAQKYKFPCKITGAGGGGCCFALINTSESDTALNEFLRELKEHNFDYFKTTLACDGIKIEDFS